MMSDIFNGLMKESKNMGETNDCSVKAVAVVTGCTYAEAHAAMKTHGRRNRRGAYTSDIVAAVESLGCKTEKIVGRKWDNYTYKYGVDQDAMKQYGFGKTVKTLMKRASKTDIYLVFVRGHVLGATDGMVHDWTNGRRHRINEIYEVVRPGTTPVAPEATPQTTRKAIGQKLTENQAYIWTQKAAEEGWTRNRTLKEIRATGASISVARWNQAWADYYVGPHM